jgi:hypothetical protein
MDGFEAIKVDFGADVKDAGAVTDRAWEPDILAARGLITPSQLQAAIRYRESARAARKEAYRAATRDVGVTLAPGLAWCVVSWGTVSGWAECKGWDRQRALRDILAGLDKLAEHYKMKS